MALGKATFSEAKGLLFTTLNPSWSTPGMHVYFTHPLRNLICRPWIH